MRFEPKSARHFEDKSRELGRILESGTRPEHEDLLAWLYGWSDAAEMKERMGHSGDAFDELARDRGEQLARMQWQLLRLRQRFPAQHPALLHEVVRATAPSIGNRLNQDYVGAWAYRGHFRLRSTGYWTFEPSWFEVATSDLVTQWREERPPMLARPPGVANWDEPDFFLPIDDGLMFRRSPMSLLSEHPGHIYAIFAVLSAGDGGPFGVPAISKGSSRIQSVIARDLLEWLYRVFPVGAVDRPRVGLDWSRQGNRYVAHSLRMSLRWLDADDPAYLDAIGVLAYLDPENRSLWLDDAYAQGADIDSCIERWDKRIEARRFRLFSDKAPAEPESIPREWRLLDCTEYGDPATKAWSSGVSMEERSTTDAGNKNPPSEESGVNNVSG